MTNTLRGWISRRHRRTAYTNTTLVVISSVVLLACLAPAGHAAEVIATVSVGTSPRAVAIDSTTNKIYVANFGVKPTSCTSITGGSVTVIDGVTYSTTTTLSGLYGVGVNPKVLAVDEATDQVYVVSLGRRYFKSFFSYLCNIPSSLARIDGQTLSTSSAFLGGLGGASSIALNPATDNIYVSAVAAT